ncbi:hypothetical protein V6N11_060354 [Hibiscus sabdariffa]|uniref:Uncharacterized protein n=1 Tax=Hibiscus sabdariffa TaxID=183260 RepID=A0ABR2QQ28_9ROSI
MVERDHDVEDVAVKDGEMMEDDSMGIMKVCICFKLHRKLREHCRTERVNTLMADSASDIRVFEEMSTRLDKQVIGRVIHIIKEFDLQRDCTSVIDSSKLFRTIDISSIIMVEVMQINYLYKLLIWNFVIQRALYLVVNCLWLSAPYCDYGSISRNIEVDDPYGFRLLLMGNKNSKVREKYLFGNLSKAILVIGRSMFQSVHTEVKHATSYMVNEHNKDINICEKNTYVVASRGSILRGYINYIQSTLFRPFFSESRKDGGICVDNISTNWDHLGVSIPMTSTLDFIEISFSDADAGGFLGQFVVELLNCWYHHDTKRPKPWLFDE